MPVQISTILYISEYKEKTSNCFMIANAIGYTRLDDNNEDKDQNSILRPSIHWMSQKEGQVLLISNYKFAKGANGEIDVS